MEINQSIEWMVRESAAGNTVVFRALYEATSGQLFRFIRARCSNREDTLDIMQDTFVDLWSTLSSKKFAYATEREFYGFLYLIARRKIAKLYRWRRPQISLADIGDIADSTSSEEHENAMLVHTSLDKLNSSDREVLELHYFAGLTLTEIASLLGKGDSAIKTRHHRALEKLREILGYQNEK